MPHKNLQEKKEYFKIYYIRNREKILDTAKKYLKNNREKVNNFAREKYSIDLGWRKKRLLATKKWREKDRKKYLKWRFAYKLKYNYGLTVEKYNSILEKQKGLCAVCKIQKVECVDHCHKTKRVRGLLCHRCNRCLGLLRDDVEILKNAINYLELHFKPEKEIKTT